MKLLNIVELVDIIVVLYYFIKSDPESLLVISETDSVDLQRSSGVCRFQVLEARVLECKY